MFENVKDFSHHDEEVLSGLLFHCSVIYFNGVDLGELSPQSNIQNKFNH